MNKVNLTSVGDGCQEKPARPLTRAATEAICNRPGRVKYLSTCHLSRARTAPTPSRRPGAIAFWPIRPGSRFCWPCQKPLKPFPGWRRHWESTSTPSGLILTDFRLKGWCARKKAFRPEEEGLHAVSTSAKMSSGTPNYRAVIIACFPKCFWAFCAVRRGRPLRRRRSVRVKRGDAIWRVRALRNPAANLLRTPPSRLCKRSFCRCSSHLRSKRRSKGGTSSSTTVPTKRSPGKIKTRFALFTMEFYKASYECWGATSSRNLWSRLFNPTYAGRPWSPGQKKRGDEVLRRSKCNRGGKSSRPGRGPGESEAVCLGYSRVHEQELISLTMTPCPVSMCVVHGIQGSKERIALSTSMPFSSSSLDVSKTGVPIIPSS